MPTPVGADELGAAHHHHHRLVVAERHPGHLTPALGVRHERQLVAVGIAADAKRRDMTVQKPLELSFRAERERPHVRMQPVGAHDQIEPILPAVREGHDGPGFVLRDRCDRHAEMDRDALTGAGERGREIGPRQADEAAALRLVQRRQVHVRVLAAVAIDHPQLAHLVAALAQRRDESHALRDLVADAPEIDEVSARSRRRRLLEQHGIVPDRRSQ